MNTKSAGFREIRHTADVEIEVWGEDKTSLFIEAAKGMYHLSQIVKENGKPDKQTRSIAIREGDLESLLVAYLSELLFYLETEHLAFDRFDLHFPEEHQLIGQLEGAEIAGQHREIKAVTFHYLDIQETDSGWRVNIVFDV